MDEPEVNLTPLEGLRGISSVMIVVGHLLTFWIADYDTHTSTPDRLVFGLDYLTPVTLFFVISGFTLVRVYDRAPLKVSTQQLVPEAIAQAFSDPPSSRTTSESALLPAITAASVQSWGTHGAAVPSPVAAPLQQPAEIMRFLRNRIARVAAMYYLGFALSVVPTFLYTDLAGFITSAIATLLALQSHVVSGIAIDGPLWTVSAFMVCYAAFSLLVRYVRPLDICGLWGVIGSVYALSVVVAASMITLGLGPLLHVLGVIRVLHFAIGVAFGYLSRRVQLSSWVATCLAEACSVILAINITACAIGTSLTGGSFVFWVVWSYSAEFLLSIVLGVWVWALCSTQCGGVTRRLMELTAFQRLGAYSYALYCLHWPIIQWSVVIMAKGGLSGSAAPWRGNTTAGWWFAFPPWAIVPLLGICLAVAVAAHHAVEEPFRRFLSGKDARAGRKRAGIAVHNANGAAVSVVSNPVTAAPATSTA